MIYFYKFLYRKKMVQTKTINSIMELLRTVFVTSPSFCYFQFMKLINMDSGQLD